MGEYLISIQSDTVKASGAGQMSGYFQVTADQSASKNILQGFVVTIRIGKFAYHGDGILE